MIAWLRCVARGSARGALMTRVGASRVPEDWARGGYARRRIRRPRLTAAIRAASRTAAIIEAALAFPFPAMS